MQGVWKFLLLHVLHFINVSHVLQTCGRDNRKIFTARQGRVTNIGKWEHDHHKVSERCEYLIRGKRGETITLHFELFSTECMFDHVFVHDGPSRSSKLLGVLTGRKDGTVLYSTTHEVYIILHTDDDHPSSHGFNLTYSINDCPRNCSGPGAGKCNVQTGECECFAGTYGDYCQYEACVKPNELSLFRCNNDSWCNATTKECMCGTGFYGQACSLSYGKKSYSNSWHNVSLHSKVLQSRAGHVSVYMQTLNILLVHGGYSFSEIYDDLIMFNFSSNSWQSTDMGASVKPSPRFNHAGVAYGDALIIFGGELRNGTYSNELWSFDMLTKSWRLIDTLVVESLEGQTSVGLKLHTMNLVSLGKDLHYLFIFGGQTSQYKMSSDLYRYNIVSHVWHLLLPQIGNDLALRVYGHTSIYYKEMNSLLIFGGMHSQMTLKTGTFTNRLLMYNIGQNIWSILKNDGAPSRLAYHTASLVGDYMVILGGLVEGNQTRGESSLDCPLTPNLYYYHLGCGRWVNEDILTKLDRQHRKTTWMPNARFSQSSAIINEQILFITGGYDHSTILNDAVAYMFPKSVTSFGAHCHDYNDMKNCNADPSCGFYNRKCSKRHTLCPGMCRRFESCETCTLQDSKCAWCTLDRTCYSNDDINTVCHLNKYKNKHCTWWGSDEGRQISRVSECKKDNTTGLKVLQYWNKPHIDRDPDGVKIVKSAEDISRTMRETELDQRPIDKVIIQGVVYPYLCMKKHVAFLKLQSNAYAHLQISDSKWYKSLHYNDILSTHDKTPKFCPNKPDRQECKKNDFFPIIGDIIQRKKLNYLFKLSSTNLVPGEEVQLKILWSFSDDKNFSNLTANYLRLYYKGDCTNYTTCMGCITDSLCGWHHKHSSCLLLEDWYKEHDDYYLGREESQCTRCDDYYDCHSCLHNNTTCVWLKYQGCKRKGQEMAMAQVTRNASNCLPSCNQLSSLSKCIEDGTSRCVWCSGEERCISLADYHLRNQFGQCYTFEKSARSPCHIIRNCSDCLGQFRCGWAYNVTDPRIGFCTEGDFGGTKSSNKSGWEYEKCPDIDECKLGIDHCKNNSRCVNVYGTYKCPCNEGYEGDGKTGYCKKKCWPECIHGECTANIKCQCHLGWTGIDCSIDCGCNNHSTCLNGTGICDLCQNNTIGQYCENCVNGSYGDATSIGCTKCICNHQGDRLRHICDRTNGTCYCVNNTAGERCQNCQPHFSHAPEEYRDDTFLGTLCYLDCSRANIRFVESSGYLIPERPGKTNPFTTCLWILTSLNVTHDHLLSTNMSKLGKSILVRLHSLKMSCEDSHLKIYDGIPPNPRKKGSNLKSDFKLLASVCDTNSENSVFRAETGVLSLLYEGRTLHDKDHLPKKDDHVTKFLAEYSLLSCPDKCPSPYRCNLAMKCVCEDGKYGPGCEQVICRNNCSDGRGKCDHISKKCYCNSGVYGEDCIGNFSGTMFTLMHVIPDSASSNVNKLELERLGSSLVLHDKVLYIFGGSHFYDFLRPSFVQFNIITRSLKLVEYSLSMPHPSQRSRSQRYGHCSFVHSHYVYIYGGISFSDFLSDMWKFDLEKREWIEIKHLKNLRSLAGHTCTTVQDDVFIFGGYGPRDGMHEMYAMKLSWNNDVETMLVLDFGNLNEKPKAMYGHVAAYHEIDNDIYFHGGMVHLDEAIQPSQKIHVFHINDDGSYSYHSVEEKPDESPPRLVGHTGQFINNTLYLFGGYIKHKKFNEKIYIWKAKCNKWSSLDFSEGKLEGDGKTNFMYLNSAYFNRSIYIFGGFNSHVSANINVFSIPENQCGYHTTRSLCLEDDCHWCKSGNFSVCFAGNDIPSICAENPNAILHLENRCKTEHTSLRKCNTFTSCVTCLSTYPFRHTKCNWCRCVRESGKCYAESEKCDCTRHSSMNKCYEVFCEGSSCKNCRGNCIWTGFLQYKSESRRLLNGIGLEYNCFLRNLVRYLPPHAVWFDQKSCPKSCDTYKSCSSCLDSSAYGIDGGHTYCMWSDRLTKCLSPATLMLICSFGRCGQMYTPNMKQECPVSCSSFKTCSQCTRATGCGWCEVAGSFHGQCIKGDLRGPYNSSSNCSYMAYDGSIDIYSGLHEKWTWVYATCPLLNECQHGLDNCDNETEICEDQVDGFKCVCKSGYRIDELSTRCKPVCDECSNGVCYKPNQCRCNFGWTGVGCNVQCNCSGHSDCTSVIHKDNCTYCKNNTQGRQCGECLPFFVGRPQVGEKCKPCKEYCNELANVCVTKNELHLIEIKNLTLDKIIKGPNLQYVQAVCLNCSNYSSGDSCDNCVSGYYFKKDRGTGPCLPCNCNGHSSVCNSKGDRSGLDCKCKHNTISPKGNRDVDKECSKCAHSSFEGTPTDGSQCYHTLSIDQPHKVLSSNENITFVYFTPSFSNVDLRMTLDVYHGVVDVFLFNGAAYPNDAHHIFKMVDSDTTPTQILNVTEKVDSNITVDEQYSFLTKYNYTGNTLLHIHGVRHRVIIHVSQKEHDLTISKFYMALVAVNASLKNQVHGLFYFNQHTPRLNLVLFFLTLVVFLMLILSGFILAWKIRTEYSRRRAEEIQETQMRRLQKRPLACYKLCCECNEDIDIIRKRKTRNMTQIEIKQNNNNLDKCVITPLLAQDTADCCASVCTVMIQLPANEFSLWNFSLGSGIFQIQPQQQQLLVRTNLLTGRKFTTRFLNTRL